MSDTNFELTPEKVAFAQGLFNEILPPDTVTPELSWRVKKPDARYTTTYTFRRILSGEADIIGSEVTHILPGHMTRYTISGENSLEIKEVSITDETNVMTSKPVIERRWDDLLNVLQTGITLAKNE